MKKFLLIIAMQIAAFTFAFGQGSNVWNVSEALTGDELVKSIIEPFEGNVVVLDVWGTWCGPCKKAMETIHPLKDEMKGKDVSFVYVACPNSQKAQWDEMIKNIDGEHYYVTTAQWNYILKTYGGGGVPLYVVFDKEGKKVAAYTGYPGNEKMKETIVSNL